MLGRHNVIGSAYAGADNCHLGTVAHRRIEQLGPCRMIPHIPGWCRQETARPRTSELDVEAVENRTNLPACTTRQCEAAGKEPGWFATMPRLAFIRATDDDVLRPELLHSKKLPGHDLWIIWSCRTVCACSSGLSRRCLARRFGSSSCGAAGGSRGSIAQYETTCAHLQRVLVVNCLKWHTEVSLWYRPPSFPWSPLPVTP